MGNASGKEDTDFTEDVNLSHFKLQRVVGRGAFGKVRIVEHRKTHMVFALKYIDKEECCRSESVRNIIRERNMLEHLDHPLVCNLRFAFADDAYMYMVLDLMLGGDLRFHLNRKNFTENAVRMWVSELACALRYLHSKHVVHRDMKPDNILLDEAGHCHITDFNVATVFDPHRPMTSHSGTLAYMAPEVFIGDGYGPSVDWWGLGVVFYESIYDRRPFQCDEVSELKRMICKGHIEFPEMDPPVSSVCVDAIRGFLTRDVDRRLGCGQHGFERMQQHPFFHGINWQALETKRVPPVFVPDSKQGNFDAAYELEELLLEDTPLESHNRRLIKEKQKEKAREEKRLRQLEKNRLKGGSGSNSEADEIPALPIEKKLRYPKDQRMQREWDLIETRFKPFDCTVFESYQGVVNRYTHSVGDPPDWVKPSNVAPQQTLLTKKSNKSLKEAFRKIHVKTSPPPVIPPLPFPAAHSSSRESPRASPSASNSQLQEVLTSPYSSTSMQSNTYRHLVGGPVPMRKENSSRSILSSRKGSAQSDVSFLEVDAESLRTLSLKSDKN